MEPGPVEPIITTNLVDALEHDMDYGEEYVTVEDLLRGTLKDEEEFDN